MAIPNGREEPGRPGAGTSCSACHNPANPKNRITGRAGFDTNGETLFIPPIPTLLMERYPEAAQEIPDRFIVTHDLAKTFQAAQMLPA